jgi:hypothetical protein
MTMKVQLQLLLQEAAAATVAAAVQTLDKPCSICAA